MGHNIFQRLKNISDFLWLQIFGNDGYSTVIVIACTHVCYFYLQTSMIRAWLQAENTWI